LFPDYRFVPGLTPHPRRDPNGHSFGTEEPRPDHVAPESWRDNQTYLYGVDLYNYGYWWESHEQFEALWSLTAPHTAEARFLQGLIQVAAANLKRHTGASESARRLAARALENLAATGSPVFMGLPIEPFIAAVRRCHLDDASGLVPMIELA
jgi:hypothetical protein